MNNASVIFDFYRETEQSFQHYLKEIPGVFETEDIHQFRVTIKKIRACFEFFEKASGGALKASKYYSLVVPVFKLAGIIRENQVNTILLNEYGAPEDVIHVWKKFIGESDNKDRDALSKSIREFNLRDFREAGESIRNFCLSVEESELVALAGSFIQHKTISIKKLLGKNWNDTVVHKIRIRLKIIKPLLNLLSQIPYSNYREAAFINLRETEKQIGAWHDRVMLIADLQKLFMIPQLTTGPLLEKIRDLMLRIGADNKKLLEEIHIWMDITMKDLQSGIHKQPPE